MPWWGWVVVGAVLLGAELMLVPTDFFLFVIGLAAIAVGAIGFVGVELPVWAQWALFGALAGAFLIVFRSWFQARRAPDEAPPVVDDTLIGEIGRAAEGLPAAGVGRIELRGVPWSARNLETTPLEAGARVRVERVAGLTVEVRRAP